MKLQAIFSAKAALALGMALAMCLSACAQERKYPKAPAYNPHPGGEFPIVATYAFYNPYMTPQQASWVKEAGFNTVQKLLSLEDTDSLLRLIAPYDLYDIVANR